MSINPDGAPAYHYQAGATAYLIDPAGTYNPAGASAPTTDPAGPYSGAGARAPTLAAAGAYIPITGATSAAAEIVDPADTYRGASAATTDPAGTDGGAGASAPTLAAAGASIPIAGATSAATEIVDLARAYSLAGAIAATTDPAGADDGPGASAPTLAAAGASIPITGRPPRRGLSTLRAPTVWRARARQRPIRPTGTAAPAGAGRRSRPLARTFQ
jgi:hypothetical protein